MKNNPGAAFILSAHPETLRNHEVSHPYRQESSFYYLCGFEEPEAFLVLLPGRMVLFVRDRDKTKEMWTGERYGVERAVSVFGADEAFLTSEFNTKMPGLLKGIEKVFYRLGISETVDRNVIRMLDAYRASQGRSGRGFLPVEDPTGPIGEMRLFKRPEEVRNLREAGRISSLAFETVMRETRPGMNEHDIEALINFVFIKNGCRRVGFNSIIAGGKNATCLHYETNNEELRDGELLLIDAGGEFDYYTADITRTFPIGKTYSPAQAKIYDLVLKAQKEAISLVRPGVSFQALHDKTSDILADGLLSLGLLKGKKDDLKRFFPHLTSHWLGMDAHDLGSYKNGEEPRKLEAGMVLTVEPGLYFQPTDSDVPEEFGNIGVRIEDDVLVTANGYEVLTAATPKERSAVEALRKP